MSSRTLLRPLACICLMLSMLTPSVASAVSQPLPGREAAVAQANGPTEGCNYDTNLPIKQVADDLLVDRYNMGSYPAVDLPHDLTWTEDPFTDRKWREREHMLRFVMALVYEWRASSEAVYLDRAMELVRSWLDLNPQSAPPSPYSWNDHATAWRAMTLVCMARIVPATPWLDEAIRLHGVRLADKRYYSGTGNHGLNQNIGLLDAGCYLDRSDWQALAAKRINKLLTFAVDTQGVSNEQAPRYDYYDYVQFKLARKHLTMCGLEPPTGYDRVERIPEFLAYATRPDRYYETIGDTADYRAVIITDTPSEFSASAGRRGDKPDSLIRTYGRGYAFGRSGWGEDRAFRDETFFSVRFGPARSHHGHDDSGGVTLYAFGSPLLVDPGYGTYNAGTWRSYFTSRAAHNVVTVDSLASKPSNGAELKRSKVTSRAAEWLVRVNTYPGVSMRRRVVFSREMGYLIVEDTMSASKARGYRQLWHLLPDAQPTTDGPRTMTHRDRGNVIIDQLIGGGTTRTRTGRTSPMQGWFSARYGHHQPAPVIEYRKKGQSVRFITLLVPFESDAPEVHATDLRLTSTGFTVTVEVDGSRELVRATSTGVRITTAP